MFHVKHWNDNYNLIDFEHRISAQIQECPGVLEYTFFSFLYLWYRFLGSLDSRGEYVYKTSLRNWIQTRVRDKYYYVHSSYDLNHENSASGTKNTSDQALPDGQYYKFSSQRCRKFINNAASKISEIGNFWFLWSNLCCAASRRCIFLWWDWLLYHVRKIFLFFQILHSLTISPHYI